jgi:hypothetical protein
MRQTVSVGSKLRKRDAPAYMLEVVELLTREGEFPHARARVSVTNNDLGVRLYSVSALTDPTLFIPVGKPPQPIDVR